MNKGGKVINLFEKIGEDKKTILFDFESKVVEDDAGVVSYKEMDSNYDVSIWYKIFVFFRKISQSIQIFFSSLF